ncbi:ABC transporter permease [Clostridium niameyense]|uniref:ABC transporter permease n=1 Tax=Clostridium niameyense TaxID=1622073 RepID=UPI00067F6B55|nr:ABC transporter permease [Clostridium niameyense]
MAEISKDEFEIIGIDREKTNEINRPNITYWQDAWRRLKENKVAIFSLGILILITLMTIIGPYLTKYKYWATDSSIINMSPNKDHWFGTDMLGRDMFARVWKGGRVSIIIGILGTIIEMTIGVIYGGISGYFGGLVDDIMMRVVEILLSIPYLMVVIIISIVLKQRGIMSLVIAMTITGWCGMARIIRGQILQVREQEYVLAARALGASSSRIIKKHLLPNAIGILIVNITLDVPSFIFGEAFLSYIGLGIQSPNTSWGSLASSAQPNLMFYPYQLFFPALFISLTMLSFNLLGDGLRDALDPKLRQ